MHTVTRETQKSDIIYVVGYEESPEMVFFTPDGIGRYFYDTVAEAQEQHGDDLPIVEIEHYDEDHPNCFECFPEPESDDTDYELL